MKIKGIFIPIIYTILSLTTGCIGEQTKPDRTIGNIVDEFIQSMSFPAAEEEEKAEEAGEIPHKHKKLAPLTHQDFPSYKVIDELFIATKTSNVRGGPSINYEVIDVVAIDSKVKVIGKVKGKNWYLVNLSSTQGFVYAPLLKKVATAEKGESPVIDSSGESSTGHIPLSENKICKEITQKVKTDAGTYRNKKLRACLNEDGVWEESADDD